MSSPLANLDAERAVLGALLAGNGDLESARAVPPTAFSAPAHQRIWEAMLSLALVGQPMDHVTLADKLKATGNLGAVGGPAYLMKLDESSLLGTNFLEHLGIVQDFARRRELVAYARAVAASAMDLQQEPATTALNSSNAFAQLAAAGARELETLEHAFAEVLDELQAVAEGKKQPCLKTGIDVWDELMGGLMTGLLTVIGAYPSVGKSALKAAFLRGLAQNGTKCGVFELEDPRVALARRYTSSGSGVPIRRLRSERLPDFLMDRVGEAVTAGYQWAPNVIVEDRTGLTDGQVAVVARQMVVQRGCKAIFIDHAGEVEFASGLERNDLNITAGVRKWRDVAKELDVAVIIFAHFHRPKGGSDSKEPRFMRPTSAMWKNSGVFEEASRVAVGLWLNEEHPDGIMATVTKQTEGEKDFDFWLPLESHAGVIRSMGGRKVEGVRGYSEGRDA